MSPIKIVQNVQDKIKFNMHGIDKLSKGTMNIRDFRRLIQLIILNNNNPYIMKPIANYGKYLKYIKMYYQDDFYCMSNTSKQGPTMKLAND